ncbi:hypothetical protein ACFL07_11330, partial [Pseudomonadota bacterium]
MREAPGVADEEAGYRLLDRLNTGLIRVDGLGKVLFMNSAAEHCLLVSRDRACGSSLHDLGVVPAELL